MHLFVTSKLSMIKRSSLTTPSPKTYAKYAVGAIGYESTISPYPMHELLCWVMNSLPASISGSGIRSMHLGLRKRALKKYFDGAKPENEEDVKKTK